MSCTVHCLQADDSREVRAGCVRGTLGHEDALGGLGNQDGGQGRDEGGLAHLERLWEDENSEHYYNICYFFYVFKIFFYCILHF